MDLIAKKRAHRAAR
jgi:hypothetical protein